MKQNTKKIVLAAILLLFGGIIIASEKVSKLVAIFQKMTIKPASLPKKVNFSNANDLGVPQNVSFLIDLKITNPDFESFSASGFGVAQLKSVDIYLKDVLIGTANINLDEIDIPAQSEYILKDLPVNGNTLSILSNATAFSNLSLTDLKFIATIEVAGIEYEIGN